MPAQGDGVLAGHQGVVSEVVGGGVGHVTGGEYMLLTNDLEVAVDMQAAMAIALPRHLFGERAGADADGPDHGAGFDALAILKGDTVCVDRSH
ncbi:hypothetical protein D3C85_1324370 [compost metagenome]